MDILNSGPRHEPVGLPYRPYLLRRQVGHRDIAAALLVAGFALAVASQWFGWFSIHQETFDASDSHVPASFGMADTPSFLQGPYYLVWLAIFTCGGAVVFAPDTRRRAWFGAAAGALATQVLIVVPVLRRPSIIIDGIVGDLSVDVHARHTAGSYLVIAAIVVIAIAMVVAVRGRALPLGADDPAIGSQSIKPAAVPVVDPSPSTPLPTSVGETVAIDFGARGAGSVETSEPVEIRIERPDHSMYVRPTTGAAPRG